MVREREKERILKLNNLSRERKGGRAMEHQVVSIRVHFIKNTCIILFLSHIIHLDLNDLQKLSLIQRDSETYSEDEGKEAICT